MTDLDTLAREEARRLRAAIAPVRVCPGCGVRLPYVPGPGRPRVVCSPRCATRLKRARARAAQ